MDNVLKIISMAVIAFVTIGFVKERAPEFSAICTIAAVLLLAAAVMPEIKDISDKISNFFGRSETKTYVTPVLKVLGITTVMKIVSDMCADAGEKAIGRITEIIGAVCALTAIMPLIAELMENVDKLI